jgi:hypothetical protein
VISWGGGVHKGGLGGGKCPPSLYVKKGPVLGAGSMVDYC